MFNIIEELDIFVSKNRKHEQTNNVNITKRQKKHVMIFILNSMNNIMSGILLLRQYKNELPERSPLLYCLLHRVNNKALCFDTCAVKVPFAQNRVFL